jgi:hypothetical protein
MTAIIVAPPKRGAESSWMLQELGLVAQDSCANLRASM